MTASTDIDRILAAWFNDAAPDAAPHGLVSAIAAATARTPRRHGWLALDRWLVRTPSARRSRCVRLRC